MSVIGYVNQYETMGNVDGPGTRFVVFLQGCTLRCQYCHNPETLIFSTDEKYHKTSDEVLNDIIKLEPYYRNGGITISGGEPLLQLDFIIDLATKLKKRNLHVAIDTAGTIDVELNKDKLDKLVENVDLFLVDIKHIDDEKAKEITKVSNKNNIAFLKYLNNKQAKVWIRYVLVPTITDDEKDLKNTGAFIKTMNNIENVEILPYHSMAKAKWTNLGLDYQLNSIRDANEDDVKNAYEKMFK